MPLPFLTARWRRPLLLSWPAPADALLPLMPPGLCLDCWQGIPYISLVGIAFDDVRVCGLPAYPRRYAEVNLRFYVRRPDAGSPAPGVVFIRQIVPHQITASAARRIYGEPFVHRPVVCETIPDNGVAYRWQGDNGGWHTFHAKPSAASEPAPAAPGSLSEFLTARYWGYNGKPDGAARAYQLTRPPWRLRPAAAEIDANFAAEYAPDLASAMTHPPASALLASDGQARIHWPRRL